MVQGGILQLQWHPDPVQMAMRSRAGFTHPGHSCRHEFSSVGTAYLYIRSNIPMSMWTQVHFIQKSTLNVDAGVFVSALSIWTSKCSKYGCGLHFDWRSAWSPYLALDPPCQFWAVLNTTHRRGCYLFDGQLDLLQHLLWFSDHFWFCLGAEWSLLSFAVRFAMRS